MTLVITLVLHNYININKENKIIMQKYKTKMKTLQYLAYCVSICNLCIIREGPKTLDPKKNSIIANMSECTKIKYTKNKVKYTKNKTLQNIF